MSQTPETTVGGGQFITAPNDTPHNPNDGGYEARIDLNDVMQRYSNIGTLNVRTPLLVTDVEVLGVIRVDLRPFYPALQTCGPFTDPMLPWTTKKQGNLFPDMPLEHRKSVSIFPGPNAWVDITEPEPAASRIAKCYRYEANDLQYKLIIDTSSIMSGTLIAVPVYSEDFNFGVNTMNVNGKRVNLNQMINSGINIDLSKARETEITIPYQHILPVRDYIMDLYTQGYGGTSNSLNYFAQSVSPYNYIVLMSRTNIIVPDNTHQLRISIDRRVSGPVKLATPIAPFSFLTKQRVAIANIPAQKTYFSYGNLPLRALISRQQEAQEELLLQNLAPFTTPDDEDQ